MTATLPNALAEFSAAFAQYRDWNKRSVGELIRTRGARVTYRLAQAFRAIAPSKEKIQAEAEARGFAIKRRVDPSTGKASPNAGGELKLRYRSRMFLAASFFFQAWKSRQNTQEGRYSSTSRASKRIGEALIHTSPSAADPFVQLTSFLPGVVKQVQARDIAAKVLREEAADMHAYIARKSQEALSATIKTVYEATLPTP